MPVAKRAPATRRKTRRAAPKVTKAPASPLSALLGTIEITSIDAVDKLQDFLGKLTIAIAMTPKLTPDETRRIKLVMQLARQWKEMHDPASLQRELRELRAIIAGAAQPVDDGGPRLETVIDREPAIPQDGLARENRTIRGRPRTRAFA